MKLDILDLMICPLCEMSDRRYKLYGDYDSEKGKIYDGHVECSKGHVWQVRDELLKFDMVRSPDDLYTPIKADYDSDEYLPFSLAQGDKNALLNAMKQLRVKLEGGLVILEGYFLPFIESIGNTDLLFIAFSHSEGVLRRAMELCAQKGIYDQFAFVQGETSLRADLKVMSISFFTAGGNVVLNGEGETVATLDSGNITISL